MLMKSIVQITLRLDTIMGFNKPVTIDLFFTETPTKEQLVEATRHFLTDQEYTSVIALNFMKMVKEGKVPLRNDYTENNLGIIFNTPTLMFENGL